MGAAVEQRCPGRGSQAEAQAAGTPVFLLCWGKQDTAMWQLRPCRNLRVAVSSFLPHHPRLEATNVPFSSGWISKVHLCHGVAVSAEEG